MNSRARDGTTPILKVVKFTILYTKLDKALMKPMAFYIKIQ